MFKRLLSDVQKSLSVGPEGKENEKHRLSQADDPEEAAAEGQEYDHGDEEQGDLADAEIAVHLLPVVRPADKGQRQSRQPQHQQPALSEQGPGQQQIRRDTQIDQHQQPLPVFQIRSVVFFRRPPGF